MTSTRSRCRRRVFGGAMLLLNVALIGCQPIKTPVQEGTTIPTWRVCFSPGGGCTQLVVDTVAAARTSIVVQAYSFTSTPIAAALAQAHQRGVQVRVILDQSQRTEHNTLGWYLAQAGIPVQIDAAHAIAHNKVMVIDHQTVITGSFNFTRAAEQRNAENLLVLRDAALASRYEENWQTHATHAEPL